MIPNTDYAPRWILDEATNVLYERQPDLSYKAVYQVTPLDR